MKRALRLAARGRGRVEPNPLVGCVLARKGRIIAEGYHRRFGGPHAEVEACRSCRTSTRGCDVYVTLEPCSHFGKTPPCTSALLEAGVGRVLVAMIDPGEHVRGRGLRQLRRAGVTVEVGLEQKEARRLNAPYIKLCTERRPWVILKWAQSIDGKLSTRLRREVRVSGEQAARLVHRWRGQVDGIITGIGTILADDPLLTARLVRPRRTAARIILDSRLRLPANSLLARSAGQFPVIVACTKRWRDERARRASRLERLGCEILALPSSNGPVPLNDFLDELGRRNMTNVMVEGGGRVMGSFFDQKLADEARVFVAPTLAGGRKAPGALDGVGAEEWPPPLPKGRVRVRKAGRDLLYTLFLADFVR
jgi:diaminohydroxyphosphoribosylaminopyrimidine deaminase/5-amino-6-(5-phosphoribosylamino)uracil reductase